MALENVGTVILSSIFWTILLVPGIFFLPIPISGIYLAIVAPAALMPIIRFFYLVMRHKRDRFNLLPVNLGKRISQGLLMGILLALGFIFVYAAWWYYGIKTHPFYLTLALLQTYLLIMVVFASTYVLAILGRTDELSFWQAFKQSIQLFLLRPGFTLVLWLQIITVGVLFVITTMAFALLYGGLLAILLNVATETIMKSIKPSTPEEL